MGIGRLLATALKNVPWTSLAMNYGPELLRKLKEQIRPEAEEGAAQHDEEALGRIRELEALVAERDRIINEQQMRIDLLDESCRTLQARAQLFRILFIVTAVAALILLGLLVIR